MTTQSRITRVALKNYKSIAACDVLLPGRAAHAAGSGLREAQHKFVPLAPSLAGESGALGDAFRFRVGPRTARALQFRNRTAVPTGIRGSSGNLRYSRLRRRAETFVRNPFGQLHPFQRLQHPIASPYSQRKPAVSRKCLRAPWVPAGI